MCNHLKNQVSFRQNDWEVLLYFVVLFCVYLLFVYLHFVYVFPNSDYSVTASVWAPGVCCQGMAREIFSFFSIVSKLSSQTSSVSILRRSQPCPRGSNSVSSQHSSFFCCPHALGPATIWICISLLHCTAFGTRQCSLCDPDHLWFWNISTPGSENCLVWIPRSLERTRSRRSMIPSLSTSNDIVGILEGTWVNSALNCT